MSTASLYRRIGRRETHSSRAGLAITLALLLSLALLWVGVEAVLAAIGQQPLLLAPADIVAAALEATAAPAGTLTAIGVVIALIGLGVIIAALSPGRRGRRAATADRTAVVVDDRVIARSLARTASYAGDVAPDQVSVSVARRRALIEVTPTSGRAVDLGEIEAAVRAEIDRYDYRPALRPSVRLTKNGTVGS
ncbi:DUF6286 domain-containing protein [Microcella daejeonensis]|uniref:DUF6286 domain-containing protein n=1 Tax=Microcella daejeonensis TaxID=2994971 RepID=A0A9E8MN03_9MICO|nr:DUF6286 domain-containing protein [Microcella daejeonensis]WAB82488.1 DUF6286 domain-containing protein [Microcella daejeonensis]